MANQYYPTPSKQPYNLIGPWNRDTFVEINPEETINMYILAPSSKTTPPAMVQVAGLKYVLTFEGGVQKGRAQYVHKGAMFCVVDSSVFMIESSIFSSNPLAPIFIGKIVTTEGPVGISGNDADQIIFVDGASAFVYAIRTNTFSQVTDDNFPTGAVSVDTLDNYFICFKGDGTSAQWQFSELNDGLSWPAENLAFIESRPDVGVAVAVVRRLLLLMGRVSTETWINPPTGNPIAPTFPFVRDNNTLFEYGCAANGSVVQGLDALFWLSYDDDGPAYIMYCDGSQPVRISTPEIENAINSLPNSNIQQASAFIYKMNGHEFYQINFPTISFLYDATTKLWFQVGDKGINSEYLRHPAESHGYLNGKHYCLAYNNGNLYELDQFYNYYDQTPMVCERITTRLFDPTYKQIRVTFFQIVLLVKEVPLTGEFSNPFLTVEVSYNRGDNWEIVQKIPIGVTGKFIERISCTQIGPSQEMVFRLTSYFPVRFSILDSAIYYDVVGN